MRNVLLVMAMLCAVSVMTSEQAEAGGGGKKKRVRLEVCNTNNGAGPTISVWALPADTMLPTTVGEARQLLPRREVAAKKTESFPLTAGDYILVAVDTTLYASAKDADIIPEDALAILGPLTIDRNTKESVCTPGGITLTTPEWKVMATKAAK